VTEAATRALAPGDVVGFVGLGRMGAVMSARLQEAGFDVRGFDVSAEAREAFAASGGTAVGSLADVAKGAAAVIVMLPTSAIVERVLVSEGLLAAMTSGALLLDMGSSVPEETRRLADVAAGQGVRMMDAPVSGGVPGARSGTLTIMVGGPAEWAEEVRPVLEHLGSQVVHVGPAGAGHALKALNNLLSASHLIASSEAMVAGMRFGLDPQVMLDVINGSSGKNWSTEKKWPAYVLPGTYSSGFALSLLVKDVGIAVDLAHSMGVPTQHAEATLERWRAAMAALPDGADHTEIARLVIEEDLRG
jgi:3-hydroxyisobutyrate dehydrogenase